MRNVQILSTGSYVPERVVTNAEVDAMMGESTSAVSYTHLTLPTNREV